MNDEVFITSETVEDADLTGRTVVVIDVLRACSTIVTALANGARAVLPVTDMTEAGRIASNLDRDVYRLGGEQGGEKIEGYDLGNSPHDYTRETVEERDVILNTSNGTLALARAQSADELLVGCFLNAERVVERVRAAGRDVTLVCAGQSGRISLEDTLCAGLLLHRLWGGDEPTVTTDTAHVAFSQYVRDRDDVAGALRRSDNARRLADLGAEEDVRYCMDVDALPLLPRFSENRLRPVEDPAERRPAGRTRLNGRRGQK
jgi:2-phosphosulfolactate phosphatase